MDVLRLRFSSLTLIGFLLFLTHLARAEQLEFVNQKFACPESALTAEATSLGKYKKCVALFIADLPSASPQEAEKIKNLSHVVLNNIDKNKLYYDSEFKKIQIESILKRKFFIPEASIVLDIYNFKGNKSIEANPENTDRQILISYLEKAVIHFSPKLVFNTKMSFVEMTNTFNTELQKYIQVNEEKLQFSEISKAFEKIIQALGNSDLSKLIKADVVQHAIGFHFIYWSHDIALNYINMLDSLDPVIASQYSEKKVKALFWQNDFQKCLSLSPSLQVSTKAKISIKVYKQLCTAALNPSKLTALLESLEKDAEIKSSPGEYKFLKSELLIANNQISEASAILEPMNDPYSQWRKIDLLVHAKKIPAAIKLAEQLNKKNTDTDKLAVLRRNLRIGAMQILADRKSGTHKKYFLNEKDMCTSLLKILPKESIVVGPLCDVAVAISNGTGEIEIKNLLSPYILKDRVVMKHFIVDELYQGL